MSLSFSENSPLLEEVTKKLYQTGAIMVAAAGNRCVVGATDDGGDDDGGDDVGGDDDGGDDDGGDSACDLSQDPLQGGVKYPARYPWVIAVGATDLYDQMAEYSRSGPEIEVIAPGGSKTTERILSTIRGGGYGLGSGTSQATAHVTGQSPRHYRWHMSFLSRKLELSCTRQLGILAIRPSNREPD
jgi:hypothetical protein